VGPTERMIQMWLDWRIYLEHPGVQETIGAAYPWPRLFVLGSRRRKR